MDCSPEKVPQTETERLRPRPEGLTDAMASAAFDLIQSWYEDTSQPITWLVDDLYRVLRVRQRQSVAARPAILMNSSTGS